MNVSAFPAAALGLTLVSTFMIRSRPVWVKLTCDLLLLGIDGGCLLLQGTSPLPNAADLAAVADGPWLRALAVVWWLVAARLVVLTVMIVLGRDARSRQTRLLSDLLAGAIYVTVALIILNSVLNLPVNGLLTTSGVIAIVLGLALQNTLADVFSGIAVGLEQPFHVGDRVTIADHAEGVVVGSNWRSIRIQTDGEDIATIPNSIVAKSQIINRSVPTERRAASLEIPTVSSASFEQITELMRQAVLLCPSVMTKPAPAIALKHIGTRTTTFVVNYCVASTPDLAKAKGQLLHHIRRLFRHAGVADGQPISLEELLRQTALFESLKPEQIDRLIEGLAHVPCEPGAIVFEQGSRGASLYIVRSGVFKVDQQEESGHRFEHGTVGPGEYLGEVSMMTGDPRPVRLSALTHGEMLELPRAVIEVLLKDDSVLSAALERSMRRTMALLNKNQVARACDPADPEGTVLGRIRRFLHLGAEAA